MFNAPFGKSQYVENLLIKDTLVHIGDGRDHYVGVEPSLSILTTGQFNGSTSINHPAYFSANISFTEATKRISDTGNQMAVFKTGDTIVISGSTSNNGIYTVATGNIAGYCVVNEALVNENAGSKIAIFKRVSVSNNCVFDNFTGLLWSRYTTYNMKIGRASDGHVNWYDTTYRYAIKSAANDMQMIAATKTLKIVGGAGQASQFLTGMLIECSGFSSLSNNIPGFVITNVAINGADLDIKLFTGNVTLVNEAAGGTRSILLICNSVFGYVAACNTVMLAGYSDWRVPHGWELLSIMRGSYSTPNSAPDPTAFPGFPLGASNFIWGNQTSSIDSTQAWITTYYNGNTQSFSKTGIISGNQYVYGLIVRGR